MTQPLLASVRHGSPKHTPAQRLEYLGWDVDERGCWNVRLAYSSTHGYGVTTFNGKSVLAHRLAHQAWVGPLVGRVVVRHSCDNRRCINPSHLTSGTHRENTLDMLQKGRHRGRLTQDDVRYMRSSGKTGAELSRELGVSETTVSRILSGKAWRWLS